ncbi:MAG: hypothetical protein EZS28_017835 [Streblomastix strix]|uniref:Uncharacterized protein n=1 Tax=Streblomastix strix TaxID=222440 RepID=A0A5J4VVG3_9EUKA|nr:MAG: hypothetical protein EZS28_017835 [Streblomastix strix]
MQKQALVDKELGAVYLAEASTDAGEEEKIKRNGHLGEQEEEQLLWQLAVCKEKDKLRTIFLLDGYRRSDRQRSFLLKQQNDYAAAYVVQLLAIDERLFRKRIVVESPRR